MYSTTRSFVLFIFCLILNACTGLDPFGSGKVMDTAFGDVGGEDGLTIDLPFAAGYQTKCTQGAHGSYSHSGTSTAEDLDLDTPNGNNDLVYAPVGGTAYVHTESSSANFGYHVNIDQGDGTYVVLAHLSDIFVEDASEVAAGQILGYEGCTGACDGDHVHIGLHEGDASKKAEYGTSMAMNYQVDDITGGESGLTLGSEDFTCGLDGGHTYGSLLPVGTWHPNGSLVKTPDDNNVYLIEDGTRRWIETEDIFASFRFDFTDVALISPAELACYGTGRSLNEEAIDAVTDPDGQIWLTFDGEDSYRIQVRDMGWENVLDSWGLSYSEDDLPPSGSTAREAMAHFTAKDGYATFRDGTLLKEWGKSDVYVVSDGVAMPIKSWEIFLKLGWGERSILDVEDGLVEFIMGTVGNCSVDIDCVDEKMIETCDAEGTSEAEAGGMDDDSSGLEEETDEPEENDSDVSDSGTNDTGEAEEETEEPAEHTDDEEDPSGADGEIPIEICYSPGEDMDEGELYLEGDDYSRWDRDPADEVEVGDHFLCALVYGTETGDEFKMNAWFVREGESDTEWAAYNNWCESIDWQGAVYVNTEEVDVTVEPWSERAWEDDPCGTGGDAYFLIP